VRKIGFPSGSYATSESLGRHLPGLTGVGDKLGTFGSHSPKKESNGANDVARCPRGGGGGTLEARKAGFNGGTLLARAPLSFEPVRIGLSSGSYSSGTTAALGLSFK